MELVGNSKGECLNLSRLSQLSKDNVTIPVISREGDRFNVSRFVISFLSDIIEEEHDTIITPAPSSSLKYIVNVLNLTRGVKIPENFEDVEILGVEGKHFKGLLQHLTSDSPDIKEKGNISSDKFEETAVNSSQLINSESNNGIDVIKEFDEKLITNVDETISDLDDCDMSEKDVKEDQVVEKKKRLPQKRDWSNHGFPLVTRDRVASSHGIQKLVITSLQCRICGELFPRKIDKISPSGIVKAKSFKEMYKRHYKRHVVKSFSCDCGVEFTSMYEKEKHYDSVHLGLYACSFEKCPKTTKNKATLLKHEETHLKKKTDKIKIHCDQCSFETHALYNLGRHKELRHPDPATVKTEKFVCNECDGREFVNKGVFKKHMERVHNPQPCPECGKVLNNIREHLKRHKTVKEFNCVSCPKGFIAQYKLIEHERVAHEGVLYKCRYPSCPDEGGNGGQGYKDASNRDAHERRRHGGSYSKRIKMMVNPT